MDIWVIMKDLYGYLMENQKGYFTQAISNKLYKSLLIDDRELIEDIDRLLTKNNSIPTVEDIEQFFKNGDGKDKVDDYFEYVTGWLKNIDFTPKDVVMAYSLARSGNQMKIGVVATVIRTIISYYTHA